MIMDAYTCKRGKLVPQQTCQDLFWVVEAGSGNNLVDMFVWQVAIAMQLSTARRTRQTMDMSVLRPTLSTGRLATSMRMNSVNCTHAHRQGSLLTSLLLTQHSHNPRTATVCQHRGIPAPKVQARLLVRQQVQQCRGPAPLRMRGVSLRRHTLGPTTLFACQASNGNLSTAWCTRSTTDQLPLFTIQCKRRTRLTDVSGGTPRRPCQRLVHCSHKGRRSRNKRAERKRKNIRHPGCTVLTNSRWHPCRPASTMHCIGAQETQPISQLFPGHFPACWHCRCHQGPRGGWPYRTRFTMQTPFDQDARLLSVSTGNPCVAAMQPRPCRCAPMLPCSPHYHNSAYLAATHCPTYTVRRCPSSHSSNKAQKSSAYGHHHPVELETSCFPHLLPGSMGDCQTALERMLTPLTNAHHTGTMLMGSAARGGTSLATSRCYSHMLPAYCKFRCLLPAGLGSRLAAVWGRLPSVGFHPSKVRTKAYKVGRAHKSYSSS
jgi:hypothetical protein